MSKQLPRDSGWSFHCENVHFLFEGDSSHHVLGCSLLLQRFADLLSPLAFRVSSSDDLKSVSFSWIAKRRRMRAIKRRSFSAASTFASSDVRRVTTDQMRRPPSRQCIEVIPLAPKTKKPAAGGGAAGFRKKPNSSWEEECCRSRRRPWEEDKSACNSKRHGRRCIASMRLYISPFCLMHRLLFAGQACAMRKADGSFRVGIHSGRADRKTEAPGRSDKAPSLIRCVMVLLR